MGKMRKKLRIGKQIPLLSTNQNTAFLYKVELDTLTNNVSFLFLILHLFKCVALLCIYIIVIVFLLIYMWDFNSIMYVFSYDTRNSWVFCPAH